MSEQWLVVRWVIHGRGRRAMCVFCARGVLPRACVCVCACVQAARTSCSSLALVGAKGRCQNPLPYRSMERMTRGSKSHAHSNSLPPTPQDVRAPEPAMPGGVGAEDLTPTLTPNPSHTPGRACARACHARRWWCRRPRCASPSSWSPPPPHSQALQRPCPGRRSSPCLPSSPCAPMACGSWCRCAALCGACVVACAPVWPVRVYVHGTACAHWFYPSAL